MPEDGGAKDSVLDQLRKNWVIITFVAWVIMTWANFRGDLAGLNKDVDSLNAQVTALNIELRNSQMQVANINGDIKEIKTSIDFIKDRVTNQGYYTAY